MTSTAARRRYRELWVCHVVPTEDPPEDVVVLSFMTARDEAACEPRWSARLVSGRALAQEVRGEARSRYIDLVARIAATTVGGRTLRQALAGQDGVSRWWFLKTSEKDCEWPSDSYTAVIRLICVRRAAKRYGVTATRVWGGPPEFAALLAGRSPGRFRRSMHLVRALAVGLLGRCAFTFAFLRLRRALRRAPAKPRQRVDVLLHSQWGWSTRATPDGRLHDRYFTDLPDRLKARGLTVGWLAVCEPGSLAARTSEALGCLVATAGSCADVIPVESYLTAREIVARAFDFQFLVRFLRFRRSEGLRDLFRLEGFDLYPLIDRQLIDLLAGPGVARLELVASAVSRACSVLRPRVLLTFLELLLQSRAIYAGARRAGVGVRLWTAQHAAYGQDKLFGVVEAGRELRGEPDGYSIPAPDGIFVMGDLSREIWIQNGFAKEAVVVTGGLRYQHVRIQQRVPDRCSGGARMLLAGSLNEGADIDMCDAVSAAIAGMASVEVRFRDHPAYRRSASPEFQPFRRTFGVSSGSLEDDFVWSDLVIFNHSSLGEEATLRGIPAWQWLWPGVNESVFLDLPVVPRFTSVAALRQALESFLRDPTAHTPSRDVQELLWRHCFGADPAGASARIADRVVELAARP